ncbi:hypothetical protein Poli38472_006193 [Pythium oligandrum]|uniref:SYO1-like TPR repeats domain-containing protein n=1 Tax=Pythium oligandrum TaxID=41045 RepID=A0A8K1CSG1_PYTOL|nr:hypothetical protein Poli38472_006193 [Pythium oligandrum]|eukprot:TMW68725.1 hypothetical protein Poli38472_006193 [Pythium oligandrum]
MGWLAVDDIERVERVPSDAKTMGKAKKLRSTSHKKRVPPTGGPTIAEAEEYANMPRDQAEMFQGLTNVQGSIREATCVALASMFGDVSSEAEEQKMREKLLNFVNAGLFRKLIPLMVDPLRMVRLHALGALRNISVTGGIDICELMTSENVVTPLVRIITETATVERFEKNDLHAVQVLEQAIALLANVCESCQAAINELTRGNLLDPIMLIAHHARTHSSLHLETLKLLLLITESNPTLNDVFGNHAQYQQVLGELIQTEEQSVSLQIRLHAVGIAMNVKAIMQNETNVAKLLPVVEAALAYDAVHVVQLAQQAAECWKDAQKTVYDDDSADLEPITEEEKEKLAQAQIKCRTWKENVQTLTLALELVADMAAADDDQMEDDEEEWASDDEEAMEQYASSQMDADASNTQSGANTPIAKALSTSRVFALSVAILQGVVSIPALGEKAIVKDFEKIRIRVVNALNNLVQQLSWDVVGNDTLPQLFRQFCTLYRNVKTESSTETFDFENATSTNDVEAATTSAMWSVLRRSSAAKQQLPIAGEDANLIMHSALQSPSVEARLNTVGLIGCVGQQSRDPAENAVVGRCLLASLSDSSLEVVTEALNALFDVYADEDFDATFKELGLLPALESTSAAIKSKLRAEQKQMDRDLLAHIKETQLNLTRFIKYKKKHL